MEFGGMGPGGGGMGRFSRNMGLRERDKPTGKITWKLVKRSAGCFMPYWKQLAASLALLLIISLLGLVPPSMTKSIIDKALPDKLIYLLLWCIGISFAATMGSSLLNVLQTYITTWVSKHIVFDMKTQMYKHLEYMPFSFFITEKQGEIITRINSDISGVESVLSGTVVNLFSNLFTVVTTAALLFYVNWKLALIGLAVLPLFIVPTRRVGRIRFDLAMKTQQKTSVMTQLMQDTMCVGGNLLLKLFAREKEEYEKFVDVSRDVMKLQIKEGMAGRWFWMITRVFTTMGPMAIYLFGGIILIQSNAAGITIGGIVMFVTLLNRLYGPVMQLSSLQVELMRSMALFERIYDYFDREQTIVDLPDAYDAKQFAGNVEFDNVCFSYKEGKEVLHNLSFTAVPGTVTALVGPSGAGKSTIISLIPRLYDTDGGVVKIDGTDVRRYTLKSMRSQIGMVTQETHMFNGTVRDNLLYSRPDATTDEIESACRSAQIWDLISSMPEGLDTFIGNGGYKLSGGEKQRLSIARVLLYDPRIVILDEATSSLDNISEAAVQQAFASLMAGRTAIVIAHRLTTIESADKILVLDDGHIVQSGTHEELLEKDGLYRTLYNRGLDEKVD